MDPLDSFIHRKMHGTFSQRLSLLLLSLVNMASGCFLVVLSIIMPHVVRDFGLSTTEISALTAINQVGAVLGAAISGVMAKHFGRAYSIKAMLTLQLIAGFSIRYFSNYLAFSLLSCVFGVFVGFCLNIVTTYVTELAPVELRGRWTICANAFLSIGKVLSTIIAYICLDNERPDSWKDVIFYITVALGSVAPFVFLVLQESLRFVFSKNDLPRFVSLFNQTLRLNSRFTKQVDVRPITLNDIKQVTESINANVDIEKQKDQVTNIALFRDHFRVAILLIIMWTCMSINVVGQLAVIPFWFGSSHTSGGVSMVGLTISGELLAVIFGYSLIDNNKFGRVKSLKIFSLLIAIFCFASYFTESDTSLVVFMVLARFAMKGTFLMLMPYSAEIFPTNLRSTAMGTIVALSGIGTSVMPFAVFSLYAWNNYSVFLFFAVNSLLVFACASQLKVDTTNKSLDFEMPGSNDNKLFD